MSNIRSFPLNDRNFLNRLRVIAQDSAKVIITNHAKLRMKERSIVMRQVFDCLQKGSLVERAHMTIQGHWKATLKVQSAGDIVQVAVALEQRENGDYAIVVTVIG